MNSTRNLKALLAASLLAGPVLAFNTLAQNRLDDVWAPADIATDSGGNSYAFFNDTNNWSLGYAPFDPDTNVANTFVNAAFNDAAGAIIPCVVTNDTEVGQLMCGFSGFGELVITNGANFRAGFSYGQWTGIGFVGSGSGTLVVAKGSSFTCASHLWVGQGATQGTVIIDGGTISIPNPGSQLGVAWNGTGGTSYITLTNGGKLYLSTWASSTLGAPGNTTGAKGIMNLADNGCTVIITNNYTSYFAVLTNNAQLLAYGGQGTIAWTYNAAQNITIISAVAPVNPHTPIISAQPASEIVASGGTATFHVGISNVPVDYQWLFNGNPITDGNGISGSKTDTLTIAGVQQANIGGYSVVATNSSTHAEFVLSGTATLTATAINLYPVVTVNGIPGNTYVTEYTTSLTPPVVWTPFATNTVGSFAPLYVVDTSTPLKVARFYQVIQQ
jgi:hypothetical protein